jgi:hypothetical protein
MMAPVELAPSTIVVNDQTGPLKKMERLRSVIPWLMPAIKIHKWK